MVSIFKLESITLGSAQRLSVGRAPSPFRYIWFFLSFSTHQKYGENPVFRSFHSWQPLLLLKDCWTVHLLLLLNKRIPTLLFGDPCEWQLSKAPQRASPPEWPSNSWWRIFHTELSKDPRVAVDSPGHLLTDWMNKLVNEWVVWPCGIREELGVGVR